MSHADSETRLPGVPSNRAPKGVKNNTNKQQIIPDSESESSSEEISVEKSNGGFFRSVANALTFKK